MGNKLQAKKVFFCTWSRPNRTEIREIFAFGFQNPQKFHLSNPESLALESGIQLKESGIQLTTKFRWQRLESSTWDPESTAWNPQSKNVLDFL